MARVVAAESVPDTAGTASGVAAVPQPPCRSRERQDEERLLEDEEHQDEEDQDEEHQDEEHQDEEQVLEDV